MGSEKKISRLHCAYGAMLGGAAGDAFASEARGLSLEEIKDKFGKKGLTKLKKANPSDETQLMLYTAHGLMWGKEAEADEFYENFTQYVFLSYQMWLDGQTGMVADDEYREYFTEEGSGYPCPLLDNDYLNKKRHPTKSILQTLSEETDMQYGSVDAPRNNIKLFDCLQRAVPCGIICRDAKNAFEVGRDSAAITHGAPEAYIATGTFAAIVSLILAGNNIETAVEKAMEIAKEHECYEQVYAKLQMALEFLSDDTPTDEAIENLGTGINAASALAIGVFCACAHYDYKSAVMLATNQSGPSDACAFIAGALKGAYLGYKSIPAKWADAALFDDEIRSYSTMLNKASKEL